MDLCIAVDLPRKRIVVMNNKPCSFEETKTLYSKIVEWHRKNLMLCYYMPVRVDGSDLVAANEFNLEWG